MQFRNDIGRETRSALLAVPRGCAGRAGVTQASYWAGTAVALALVLLAGIADWRRLHRRRSIDNVGWVPWRGIQAAAFFMGLGFFILAIKT